MRHRFIYSAIRAIYWLLYHLLVRHLPRSDMPYSFGSKFIRAFVCKKLFARLGQNVNIESKVTFYNISGCEIGHNSGIGFGSYIGTVKIGNDVMIGPEAIILSVDHAHADSTIPMRMQGHRQDRPVIIDDDVWIGTRAIILPGLKIGRGSIVAAGAVVTKEVQPWSIVGGNPAKLIRKRKHSPDAQ